MKNLLFVVFFAFNLCFAQQVTTVAGSNYGYSDGNVMSAMFNSTTGVCSDASGNLYVADESNNRIRKITTDGMVTTLAGSGLIGSTNGSGTSARFSAPHGLCVDAEGNVYVAERVSNRIRKITPNGTVSTFATGFQNPYGVCIDKNGILYVADTYNHKIKKITPQGVVTTFAGSTNAYQDGQGTSAAFSYPEGICVDAEGNVFVADYRNQRIRKITPNGYVSTVAGTRIGYQDGEGAIAQFNYPAGITVDSLGNLYVAEEYNHTIRKIDTNGVVSTFAGTTGGYLDGSVSVAKFFQPCGVYIDASNVIYVADQSNNKIRTITVRLLEINENNTILFKLYPNPVSSILNIQLAENLDFQKANIYNTLGQLIKAENKKEINVSDLSKGSYFIEVITDKGKATKSFIVE
jgi:sugar lactone lactonase YvrE